MYEYENKAIEDIESILKFMDDTCKPGFFQKIKNILFGKNPKAGSSNEKESSLMEDQILRTVRGTRTITDTVVPNLETNPIFRTDFLSSTYQSMICIMENQGHSAAEMILRRYADKLDVLYRDPFGTLINICDTGVFDQPRFLDIFERLDVLYTNMRSTIIGASVRKPEYNLSSLYENTCDYMIAALWCALTEKDVELFYTIIDYWWCEFMQDYILACQIYYDFSERTSNHLDHYQEIFDQTSNQKYEILMERFGDSISIMRDSKFATFIWGYRAAHISKSTFEGEWKSILSFKGFGHRKKGECE